jgi:hypothetical protein
MLNAAIRLLARLREDAHTAVAVNVGRPGAHTSVVSVSGTTRTEGGEVSEERNELTDDELARQKGEQLPERTQMSVMHPPWSGPPPGAFEVFPNPDDPLDQSGPVKD